MTARSLSQLSCQATPHKRFAARKSDWPCRLRLIHAQTMDALTSNARVCDRGSASRRYLWTSADVLDVGDGNELNRTYRVEITRNDTAWICTPERVVRSRRSVRNPRLSVPMARFGPKCRQVTIRRVGHGVMPDSGATMSVEWATISIRQP